MRCSSCQTTFYCSVECQRRHWAAEHKGDCRDVKSMRTQEVGGALDDPIDISLATAATPAEDAACYICLSEPIVDPYTIPGCCHSFCFGCLREWQGFVRNGVAGTTGTDGGNDTSKMSCPACRADAPDIDKSIFETAMLYATRAANNDVLDMPEKNELQEKALVELEKLQGTKNMATKFQSLFTKAQILLALEKPTDAIEVTEELLRMHERETENFRIYQEMFARGRTAVDEDRDEVAEQIYAEIEKFKEENCIDRFPEHAFDVYVQLADAKEQMEDWEGAKEIYIEHMLKKITEPSIGSPPLQRMMWMGISKCMYHLGDYQKAIHAGTAAIEMNRHFPQVHKYVALAQKASGDIEAARVTMAKAVSYETPWDEQNKAVVLKMYEDMMADDR